MILFALCMGVMAWVGTNNFWIALAFLGMTLGDAFFFLNKAIAKHTLMVHKKHECFQFVNSFIIALSVKKTLGNAYQTVVSQTSGPLLAEMNAIKHLTSNEALEYLLTYFESPSYGLFLNVIHLYEDQGGDILVMGEFLVNEIRRDEEKLTITEKMGQRKLMNFIVLWLMTLVILVFCRFGISGFYQQMLENQVFVWMIVFFLFFLLFSVHVFLDLFLKQGKR